MAVEIEKKFLLKYFPSDLLSTPKHICQGYMLREKDKVVRIRIADDQGYLTIKGKTVNSARKEFEYSLPVSDAREMLSEFCVDTLIEKKRYHIDYKGFEWVIDLFSGKNKGLIVAEIELDSIDQEFEKPKWIGLEVTHDPRYFNSNLVDCPYSEW